MEEQKVTFLWFYILERNENLNLSIFKIRGREYYWIN